jgi:hypothetical protein
VTAVAGHLDRRAATGDKGALSARRRYRETAEVVGATRRLMKVIGKRIATEDPDDLRHLVQLEQELRQAWGIAIAGIRASGFTDSEIGEALGTSKQAVQQRWPRRKP